MIILTAACLIGILIGLQFRFVMLIPVTLALAIFWGLCAIAFADKVSLSLANFVLAVVALQASYMIGLTWREFFGHLHTRFSSAQPKA